jgi:hypothetical protein
MRGHDNISLGAMNRENRLLVTNEPVEAQDSRTTTDRFRRIYRIHLKLNKEKAEDHNM